jgi:hypothetical protein
MLMYLGLLLLGVGLVTAGVNKRVFNPTR